MSVTPQTLGIFGAVKIGGQVYTALAAPRLICPENWVVEPIVGNAYEVLYAPGLRQPVVEMEFCPRDLLGDVLSSTFLAYFFSRTAGPVFDAPLIGDAAPTGTPTAASPGNPGIRFSDGVSLIDCYGVKADSLTLSTAKGENLRVVCRFAAASIVAYDAGATGVAAACASLIPVVTVTNPALRFSNVTFGGSLASVVFAFSLTWSNNLAGNMALNGSVFPVELNAQMPTAGFSYTVQAGDTVPRGETNAAVTVTGAAGAATFTAQRMIVNNPDDRAIPQGRVLRSYSFRCLGAANANANLAASAPITYTSTF